MEAIQIERNKDFGIASQESEVDSVYDGTETYSSSKSAYTESPSEYGNACVAYAEQDPVNDYSSERYVAYSEEYGSSIAYSQDGNVCIAHVQYAEQETPGLYGEYKESGGYEDVGTKGSFTEDIYAYIAEYEEIDEDAEYSSISLDGYYVKVVDDDPLQRALKRRTSPSCFSAILNPHQLLFGWKSKVPWACQTTLRTWSRVLSTRMGVQFSTVTSTTPATVTFLRRTLKDYQKRPPNSIQFHESLPDDFLWKIQTVFDMAKHKPTRYKHVIGISCFPIHMSMPKSLWKDLALVNDLTTKNGNLTTKNGKNGNGVVALVSTDAAADRLGHLQRIVTSFYAKRHGLNESSLRAYLLDTGPGFRHMHSSAFAMKALSCLAKRGQSILLPEPCHPTLSVWFNVFQYTTGVTPRYYRRDPNRSWMLDIGDLQEKIDDTTAAVFMSNPSVMSGGLSSYRELSIFVGLLAKRRIPLIMEETMDYLVYDQHTPHSVLELKPTIPVILINSIYRWMIFGAQGPTLAWSFVYDPESLLPNVLHESLQALQTQSLKMSSGLPAPSIVSSILHYDGWAKDIVRYLAKNMSISVGMLRQTPGLIIAPPKAGYFLIVLLDYEAFGGQFSSDIEFTTALFNEESVKVVCGSVLLGWGNSFGLEMYMRRDLLMEACDRIDLFCRRHTNQIKFDVK